MSNRVPHIVFFNRSFHPEISATAQLLAELGQDLVHQHGCRVSVVTASAGDRPKSGGLSRFGLLDIEHYRGMRILRAKSTGFAKQNPAGRISNYVTYFLSACLAGLRLDRPDVVVGLTDPPIIGLAAYLAARRFRTPLVMAYKDIFPEAGHLLKSFQSTSVDWALQRVNCFLAARADRVVALGESMRRKLIEEKNAAPLRTQVIEDWADCSNIFPGPKVNPFSLTHNLSGRFVVMHSGNLGLAQNLEDLIEAAQLLREYREIQFVLIGEGTNKASLELKAKEGGLENVLFLPFQPKGRLFESYATADLFWISLKKGLGGYIVPSKLYSILAAGRPYVAAVEEESEIYHSTLENQCGLLVIPGDPKNLAAKILQLYRDPQEAARLGQNGRKAASRFDRSLQIAKYAALFQEAMREKNSYRSSVAKRSFDIALSLMGLLLLFPVGLISALGIRLQDGGPIFYSQDRVGKDGRRFKSLKLRSMHPGSDRSSGPLQAKKGDPRVTPLGRILRATAMDELPQLWNILVGQMSFVGPRPLLPEEIEVQSGAKISIEEIPGYPQRQRVTPGLTGLAQVFAPRDRPRQQKFRLDLLYIRKQTFWLDLKLLALSVWITIRGKWEEGGDKLKIPTRSPRLQTGALKFGGYDGGITENEGPSNV